jgi:hypothetical protein
MRLAARENPLSTSREASKRDALSETELMIKSHRVLRHTLAIWTNCLDASFQLSSKMESISCP